MAFRSSFESRARNAPSRSHVRLNYNPRVRRVRNNRRRFIVRSPSVQDASRRDATNLAACGRALRIGRDMNLYSKTAPLLSSFMGSLVGERTTVADIYGYVRILDISVLLYIVHDILFSYLSHLNSGIIYTISLITTFIIAPRHNRFFEIKCHYCGYFLNNLLRRKKRKRSHWNWYFYLFD